MRVRLHSAAAVFWRESYRELRRHAGDERLPHDLRASIRNAAHRALGRSALEQQRAVEPRWNRRALRHAPRVALPAGDAERLRIAACELGVAPDSPTVTVEMPYPLNLLDALPLLAAEGYQIVRIGEVGDRPLHAERVVDIAASGRKTPGLDAYLLLSSAFLICSSPAFQELACLTHTPSLRLDARDPFTAYPVRPDSSYTLATAVDLDSGRAIGVTQQLSSEFFRNTRNYGYRRTSAADIAAAVAEMIDGVRHGWKDSEPQARFRLAVAEAGSAIGSDVRHLVEWDAAGGFVGDGRLARVQAERAA
jgi:putative glycosyltransferase (TIGR04372 family)